MPEPITLVELRPQQAVTIRRTVPRAKLGEFFMEAYPKLSALISSQGARPDGPPFARYYNNDPAQFDMEAGIPFSGTVASSGELRVSRLPGGKAAKVLHIGTYETLAQEYGRITSWLEERKTAGGEGPWESYVDDPAKTPMEKVRTEVYWPLR